MIIVNNIEYEIIHSSGLIYYLQDKNGYGGVYDSSINEFIHGKDITKALGGIIEEEIKEEYYILNVQKSIEIKKEIINEQLSLF